MKLTLVSLKVGDMIRARVHEVLDSREIIFSFDGDLLRVVNDTRRAFKADEQIVLRVTGVNPFQFRFHDDAIHRSRRPGHFDIVV